MNRLDDEIRRIRLVTPRHASSERFPLLFTLASDAGVTVEDLLRSAIMRLSSTALREAARDEFGISARAADLDHPGRVDLACQHFPRKPRPNTYRQQPGYLKQILRELQSTVMTAATSVSTEAEEEAQQQPTIRRDALILAGSRLIDGGAGPVLLWGEPGCGKTSLARMLIAHRAKAGEIIALVRNVRQDTPGSESVYEQDIKGVLQRRGLPCGQWSLTTCEQALSDLIASRDAGLAGLIIDDADALTAQKYSVTTTRVPVVLTSRTRLAIEGPELQIGVYTPAEAQDAWHLVVPEAPNAQVEDLSARLGWHPEAISIVAHLVAHEFVTMQELQRDLPQALSDILDTENLLFGEGIAGSPLSAAYDILWHRIRLNALAEKYLSAFIWLSSGTLSATYADSLMASATFGTSDIRRRVAYTVLQHSGVVRREQGAYVINHFTVQILRIRQPDSLGTAVQVLDSPIRDGVSIELQYKKHMRETFKENLRTIIPREQSLGALCLDSNTWLIECHKVDQLPSGSLVAQIYPWGLVGYSAGGAFRISGQRLRLVMLLTRLYRDWSSLTLQVAKLAEAVEIGAADLAVFSGGVELYPGTDLGVWHTFAVPYLAFVQQPSKSFSDYRNLISACGVRFPKLPPPDAPSCSYCGSVTDDNLLAQRMAKHLAALRWLVFEVTGAAYFQEAAELLVIEWIIGLRSGLDMREAHFAYIRLIALALSSEPLGWGAASANILEVVRATLYSLAPETKDWESITTDAILDFYTTIELWEPLASARL